MRSKINTYQWLLNTVDALHDNEDANWMDYPCLDWPFSTTVRTSVKVNPTAEHRYGQTWRNGRVLRSHRAAWEVKHGEVPEGLCILHKCDRPICFRPVHLFPGTYKENYDDMASKGHVVGHGDLPMIRGESHGMAKLTWEEVREIRRLGDARKSGVQSLASHFNVCQTTIKRILRRTHWLEIADPLNQ